MGAVDQGANATQGRWLTIPRTLCFVRNGDAILLMKRAPHKRIFPNRYNGLGGHIERDEDPYTGAEREIMEESGLVVTDLQLRSIHNIDVGDETGIILFVFTANCATRDITVESPEGTLEWVPINQLENYDLVEDLPIILPRILAMTEDHAPLYAHISYSDSDQIQIRYSREGRDG